jgi:hypothetical protein
LQGLPEGLLLLFVQQSPLIPYRVIAVLIDEPFGSLGVVALDELVDPVLAKPGGLAHRQGAGAVLPGLLGVQPDHLPAGLLLLVNCHRRGSVPKGIVR